MMPRHVAAAMIGAMGGSYPIDARPRLYEELASWFHLLTAPAEYEDEAEFYRRVLTSACSPPPVTLLELGSGGGNTASHLKKHFSMTLSDLSDAMLAVSRSLNPECEHVQGDMRTLRLGREFDAVLIHDAIMYMLTEEDLAQAMATAFIHCRPGGVVILSPDDVRESLCESTDSGGNDRDGRSLRYLEWSFDPDPGDTTFETAFVYLLRDTDGSMRVELDRHRFGVFPRDTWLRLLTSTGFEPRVVPDEWNRENFVGIRPPR